MTDRPANANAMSQTSPTTNRIDTDLAARREQTLERLGRASVQPGPLLELLKHASDDPNAVVGTLERCPALAARVLAVTNSAGFGLAHPIHALPRAVIHLGASRARAIALAYALKLLSDELDLDPKVLDNLWTSSLCKAATARLAADQIDPRHAEAAYAESLIQDVGLPALVAMDPGFYENLQPTDTHGSWSALERAHFGLDHAEFGAALLRQWNAAEGTCRSVLEHHRPPVDADEDQALCNLPRFIASLLPHLGEPMTATEHQWMLTLHAKFFADAYNTPEAFIGAACQVANPFEQSTQARREMVGTLTRRLPEAIAADAVSLVEQLCQLEGALSRERKNTTSLRYEAFTDPLTRVLNRRGLAQFAHRRMQEAIQRRSPIVCMMLDLDAFKHVNDRYGHDGGDLLLQGLASVLRKNIDRADLVGRLGGDEFAVLITIDSRDDAERVAHRLYEACRHERVSVSDTEQLPLSLSLGAVFCEKVDASVSLDDLLAAADEAMYQRKRAGKQGVVFQAFTNPAAPSGPPAAAAE